MNVTCFFGKEQRSIDICHLLCECGQNSEWQSLPVSVLLGNTHQESFGDALGESDSQSIEKFRKGQGINLRENYQHTFFFFSPIFVI